MNAAAANHPAIELRGVFKSYYAGAGGSTQDVLRDISLEIAAGDFVAITGASGSGKSTLMNIIGCLDRPTSGSYRLDGVEITRADQETLAKLRREVFGFVFQQYHLVPGRTALENVALPAMYGGASPAERRERAGALLDRLGLADRHHHRPSELSGGQQQRVSIARALMNGGRIILADEPTGALDSKSGAEVLALLQKLWREGHTVLVVTHDREVARTAARVVELRDGVVIADVRTGDAPGAGPTAPPARTRGRALWSEVSEAWGAARQSLAVNPARTLLTLLGVVVGVAAIIALLAIGEGARRAVLEQLAVFGTNRLYVFPGAESARDAGGQLTESDAEIVRTVPNVTAAMPYLKGSVIVRYGNTDHRTTGVAITSDFPRILNWAVERGVFFTETDERSLATVALIGRKLEKLLFAPGEEALERFVLVNNVPFQIIGVLSEKGALTGDSDDDDTIVFPFPTGSQRIYGTRYLSWISVLIDDLGHADETVTAITAALTDKHRLKDFEVYNKAATVAAQTRTMDIMTSLLAFTAVISLVVGGIGIMNIMLMTVGERTREIGIRAATGARPRDILNQFLAEAIALSAIGGVIGVVLGVILAFGAQLSGMPIRMTPGAALTAFACAVSTGIFFGYAPARRAARLDPVAALARQ
ncbi:MAG TPA: MacB family efflux pump subunit [Polyangiaceae bacterium]|nr:MacB family efflux pump subunit [Polyangiaceae bacterium]